MEILNPKYDLNADGATVSVTAIFDGVPRTVHESDDEYYIEFESQASQGIITPEFVYQK